MENKVLSPVQDSSDEEEVWVEKKKRSPSFGRKLNNLNGSVKKTIIGVKGTSPLPQNGLISSFNLKNFSECK
jgi:hypothetical protein